MDKAILYKDSNKKLYFNIPQEDIKTLSEDEIRSKHGLIHQYSLYDGEGEFIYWGWSNNTSNLEPLDYAKMHAGCTDIYYYNSRIPTNI